MEIDHLRIITAGIEVERPPRFRVGEVAKFFFAKSTHWVRWRERNYAPEWEPGSTVRGARLYDLADVEVFTRLLLADGAISYRDAESALGCVRAQVDLYRLRGGTYYHEGQEFPLVVADVAEALDETVDWVYRHAESLGGVRRFWDDGTARDAWRFPDGALGGLPSASEADGSSDYAEEDRQPALATEVDQ